MKQYFRHNGANIGSQKGKSSCWYVFDSGGKQLIQTTRRLRLGHSPNAFGHYKPCSSRQILQSIIAPKKWSRLDVQIALWFFVGSMLFIIGSVNSIEHRPFTSSEFLAGSLSFTIAGALQIIQAWTNLSNIFTSFAILFSASIISSISAKVGSLLYNLESIFNWTDPNAKGMALILLCQSPYTIGSCLFFISGLASYAEIAHGRLFFIELQHIGWWVVIFSITGSLLYILSSLFLIANSNLAVWLCLFASIIFAFMSILLFAECDQRPASRSLLNS